MNTEVNYICPTRGTIRGRDGGMLFKTFWDACHEPTCEPIDSFVSIRYTNVHIMDVMKEFYRVAKKHPHSKRTCVTCDTRVKNGDIFCNHKRCKWFDTRFKQWGCHLH